jgi:hypothetical protein
LDRGYLNNTYIKIDIIDIFEEKRIVWDNRRTSAEQLGRYFFFDFQIP